MEDRRSSKINPKDRLADIEAQMESQAAETGQPIFRLDYCVELEHEDGSHLFFRNAKLINEGEWVFVLTEHCGSHWFHEDDLTMVRGLTIDPLVWSEK